jgi:Uncharacterised conserved protein (DUF2362)
MLICEEDMTVRLRLPVGGRYVIGEIHLRRGDNAKDVLAAFMLESEIPMVLMEPVWCALRQSIRLERVDESDALDTLASEYALRQRAGQWQQRLKSMRSSGGCHNANENHRHCSRPKSQKNESQNCESQKSASQKSVDYLNNESNVFVHSFSGLAKLSDGDAIETLRQLEGSYALKVRSVAKSRDEAMRALHERQSQEMGDAASASRGGDSAVSTLVAKHVHEMEALQGQWKQQLRALHAKQRAEYRNFVVEFYARRQAAAERSDAVVAELHANDGASDGAPAPLRSLVEAHSTPTVSTQVGAASLSSSSSSSAKPQRRGFFWQSAGSAAGSTSESSIASLLSRGKKGRAKRKKQPQHNKPTRGRGAKSGALGSGGADAGAPEELDDLDVCFDISIGAQQKSLYNLRMMAGRVPPLAVDRDAERRVPSPNMLRSIYSTALSASLFMVEADLTYSTKTERELVELCSARTDFHFDTMSEQLARLRIAAHDRLKPGDFFVTKHSNLSQCHLVFHMVADAADASALITGSASVAPALVAGLCNVLALASHYGVATLALPVLMLRDVPDHLVSADLALQRAQHVIRAVKAFLVRSADQCFFRSCTFVVPIATDQALLSAADDSDSQEAFQRIAATFQRYQRTLDATFQSSKLVQ